MDLPRPAAVAFVEGEQGRVLLVRVPRYTTGLSEWELPAGGMEPGEAPVETVRREALEETGYRLAACELIYSYYPLPGVTNKLVHVLRGRAQGAPGDFDRGEVSEVAWFTPAAVRRLIQKRHMHDGIALVATLLRLRDAFTDCTDDTDQERKGHGSREA